MAEARGPLHPESPQDEKNYHPFEGNEDKHENDIPTNSDLVTGDEQPPIANNAGEPLSLPPRRMPYPEPQRFIEILSSTTELSYEDNITATTLTRDEYQIIHGYSSPHPQVINYAISDQYVAGINSTDQEYLIAAAQTISEAHHGNNISISIEQSVSNCLIYNTYSTTESGGQRLPEELVTKVHDIIFYHYAQCLSPKQ